MGHYGRLAYQLLGGLVIVSMVPVGLIFFRHQPERYGLLPDGGWQGGAETEESEEAEEAKNEESEPLEENWTLSEVVRTTTFWLIALGIASVSMLITGITFHVVSIFVDNGLSADLAATIFLPMSIVNAVMGLVCGILIDRIPAKYMLSFSLLLLVVILLMSASLTSPTVALIYGIIIGVMGAFIQTIQNVIWANYYGRQNLGVISGLTGTIGSAASGLGPIWFGIGRDLAGSYVPALLISAILPFVLAILVLFIRRPRRVEVS